MPSGVHDNHTGPKRTRDQRSVQMAEMVRMIARGYRKTEIARKFQLDPSTITRDWKVAIGQIKEDQDQDLSEWRATVIASLHEMMREAWEAWEKSKVDATSETEQIIDPTQCTGCGGMGVRTGKSGNPTDCIKCGGAGKLPGQRMVTKVISGRLPMVQYLSVIEKCQSAIRALKGLDAETQIKIDLQGELKHKHSGQLDHNIQWDHLWRKPEQPRQMTSVEEIEARIAAAGTALPISVTPTAPSDEAEPEQGQDEEPSDEHARTNGQVSSH